MPATTDHLVWASYAAWATAPVPREASVAAEAQILVTEMMNSHERKGAAVQLPSIAFPVADAMEAAITHAAVNIIAASRYLQYIRPDEWRILLREGWDRARLVKE